jgi:hypothetical protein
MKNRFFGTILFFLLTVIPVRSQQEDLIRLNITYPLKPVENFQGFGAEWDSRAYNWNNVTDSDFEKIASRIKWMKMPIVRIMMLAKWCYSPEKGYDFENEDMKLLYRHLSFCQANGIDVMISDWGIEPEWLRISNIENMAHVRYSEIVGEYMDYLINKKGFTCIKYFGLVNEPNYEVGDFGKWAIGLTNVYYVFKERELLDRIKIVAPGQSNDKNWFFSTVDVLQKKIDVYDMHLYAWKDQALTGGVFNDIKELWNYAQQKDSAFDGKMFFVTEAGMRDGQSAEVSTNIDSFYYGVFMVDYAIQAVHAGANAVLAWMLDDNSHPDFKWGLWRNKKNGMNFREWFYSWSLLVKNFPKGSKVYKVRSRSIEIRALAAKINSGKNGGWSFCVVNLGDKPAKIQIKVDGEKSLKMNKYLYVENEYLVDENGFPKPNGQVDVNLADGTNFDLMPKSVLFLTSANR